MGLAQALLARLAYIKACAGPGRAAVLGILAGLGLVGTIRDNFFPGTDVAVINWIPPFPWYAWTVAVLVALFALSIEGGYRVQGKLREENIQLTTPNISVEFLELRSKYGVSELSITIKNLSHTSIRAETWCTAYTVTKKDEEEGIHTEFEVAHFVADQFTLTSEEPHNPAVLRLYEKELFGPIKVTVPNKRQYDLERLYGDEFAVTFTVYGGLNPVSISFRCAIKDVKLWAEKIEEQTTATS